MNKLQFFIIIFGALLVSYNCLTDFIITADGNSFYVDFDSSRQSVLTVSNQDTPNKSSLSSTHFGPLYTSGNVGTTEFQLDADVPEKSEIYDSGVALISSAFESTPILAAHAPAIELYHFPSEAYRLRI